MKDVVDCTTLTVSGEGVYSFKRVIKRIGLYDWNANNSKKSCSRRTSNLFSKCKLDMPSVMNCSALRQSNVSNRKRPRNIMGICANAFLINITNYQKHHIIVTKRQDIRAGWHTSNRRQICWSGAMVLKSIHYDIVSKSINCPCSAFSFLSPCILDDDSTSIHMFSFYLTVEAETFASQTKDAWGMFLIWKCFIKRTRWCWNH